MAAVTVRELRNHAAEVLDRVAQGESIIVTRDGRPVAKLTPLRRRGAPPSELIARRRALPAIELDELRSDLNEILDASL